MCSAWLAAQKDYRRCAREALGCRVGPDLITAGRLDLQCEEYQSELVVSVHEIIEYHATGRQLPFQWSREKRVSASTAIFSAFQRPVQAVVSLRVQCSATLKSYWPYAAPCVALLLLLELLKRGLRIWRVHNRRMKSLRFGAYI